MRALVLRVRIVVLALAIAILIGIAGNPQARSCMVSSVSLIAHILLGSSPRHFVPVSPNVCFAPDNPLSWFGRCSWLKNAARCIPHRNALQAPSQRAAKVIAP